VTGEPFRDVGEPVNTDDERDEGLASTGQAALNGRRDVFVVSPGVA